MILLDEEAPPQQELPNAEVSEEAIPLEIPPHQDLPNAEVSE